MDIIPSGGADVDGRGRSIDCILSYHNLSLFSTGFYTYFCAPSQRSPLSFRADRLYNYNCPFTLVKLKPVLHPSGCSLVGPDDIYYKMLWRLFPVSLAILLAIPSCVGPILSHSFLQELVVLKDCVLSVTRLSAITGQPRAVCRRLPHLVSCVKHELFFFTSDCHELSKRQVSRRVSQYGNRRRISNRNQLVTSTRDPDYYYYYYEDYYYQDDHDKTTTTTTTTTTPPPRRRFRGRFRRPRRRFRVRVRDNENLNRRPFSRRRGRRPPTNTTTTSTTTTTTTPVPTTTRRYYPPRYDGRYIDYLSDPNLPRELNGVDLNGYPFFPILPDDIIFECNDRHDGYYASVPHRCQLFHYCFGGQRFDFLCPNYTLYDQQTFTCRFVNKVDCASSELFYHKNDALYVETTTLSDEDQESKKKENKDDDYEYYYDE
ncbi:uncharacterized protein LOC143248131 [Tachypleus tridentatus]|uniref:uncharacterized protein LOC143248131 n=1 Tax=Tachypleus tridentatus TaxID=6853 RepID=UPI003FD510C6